jgi:hypothetical protein
MRRTTLGSRWLFALGAAALLRPPALPAQSLDLTVNNFGISFGDSRRVNGLRINYRDRRMREVNGVNITVWTPYEEASGVVNGIALGLPVTGARTINGLATGVLGVGADDQIRGIGIAPLGLGAGGKLAGIMIGGLGAGGGGDIEGIAIGGLGVGGGGSLRGIIIGGAGAGGGGDATGIMVGGLGTGVGGRMRGLSVGGLGAGAGGSLSGIAVGGLGVGSGGDVTGLVVGGLGVGSGGTVTGIAVGGVGVGAGAGMKGLAVGGLGVGSGGTLEGITIAGLGVGAPQVSGVAAALAVGGEDVRWVVLAPAYLRITPGGRLTGVSGSAFNHVRGEQHGLAIGVFNYADELHGVQLGVLNYARNNRKPWRLLPIVNVHFEGSGER